jgi:hypothetical protein
VCVRWSLGQKKQKAKKSSEKGVYLFVCKEIKVKVSTEA